MIKKAANNVKAKFSNNKKIVENYFFMTALQIINSVFGILIYPFIIRKLGVGNYGLYVFAVSVTMYFIGFISFGFSFPALKAIVLNKDNDKERSKIVSIIFSSKLYIGLISCLIFSILLFTIPIMIQHKIIFLLCFSQIFGEIMFPVWYFQGMQKMKLVTYIQLSFKFLSLPFIFLLIKSSDDLWIYAVISSLTINLGGIASIILLIYKENIRFSLMGFALIKDYFRESIPFFWSSVTGVIKQESATILIGTFLGMRDVALYDLANKIIIIPRLLTTNINSALFPKVLENIQKEMIRKIIKYETVIGLAISAGIIMLGYWVILLLGGPKMTDSYPLAIILSFTVLVWLVVGSYINFIFVPEQRYYFVSKNQLVALVSFFILCIPGLLLFPSVYVVVSSLTLSGISEIVYCNYLIKKHKLL